MLDGEIIIMNDPVSGIPFLGWSWVYNGQRYYASLFHFTNDDEWNLNMAEFMGRIKVVATAWDMMQATLKEQEKPKTEVPQVFRKAFENEVPP